MTQWKLEKHNINEFIKLIRRILKNQTSWVNENIDIVQLSSGSGQLVFEQFFEERETYPVITVQGAGGSFINNSINDYLSTVSPSNCFTPLGERRASFIQLPESSTLEIPIPDDILTQGDSLGGFYFEHSNTLNESGTINYEFYKTYTNSPQLLSSGSVECEDSTRIQKDLISFIKPVIIDSSNYYLTLSTIENEIHNVFTDPNFSSYYELNSQQYSGSILGGLFYTPKIRVGGRFEGSIIMRIFSKNSSAPARDLSEILATRFLSLRHAEYDRTAITSDQLESSFVSGDNISEWFSKEIIIRGVRVNPIEVRKRGSNDNIFLVTLSVDILTHWHTDYDVEFLKEIDVTTISY